MLTSDSILYETECTYIDFKKMQYTKDMHFDLLKDIMSMANANYDGEKYIVVGVKHTPDNSKEFYDIERESFVDSAIYTQLVEENIEPQLNFKYEPYVFSHPETGEEHLLGLFIISQTENKPYMMKKKYSRGNNNLEVGESWIRKGSSNSRMNRRDYDNIYIQKSKKNGFENKIFFSFSDEQIAKEIRISGSLLVEDELPSEKYATSKQRKLNELTCLLENDPSEEFIIMEEGYLGSFPKKYNRDAIKDKIEKIKQCIADARDIASEHDEYYLYSKKACFLPIFIHNLSDEYIEDVNIFIDVNLEETQGFYFYANKVIKPRDPYDISAISNISVPNITYNCGYDYKKKRISSYLKQIEHLLPVNVLPDDSKVLLRKEEKEYRIKLMCKIYAKNLPKPYEQELYIEVY